MLEQVVARDPGYAPAWALLGKMSGDRDKSEMAAREALRLDPATPPIPRWWESWLPKAIGRSSKIFVSKRLRRIPTILTFWTLSAIHSLSRSP
jgi:hypothetical protein